MRSVGTRINAEPKPHTNISSYLGCVPNSQVNIPSQLPIYYRWLGIFTRLFGTHPRYICMRFGLGINSGTYSALTLRPPHTVIVLYHFQLYSKNKQELWATFNWIGIRFRNYLISLSALFGRLQFLLTAQIKKLRTAVGRKARFRISTSSISQ